MYYGSVHQSFFFYSYSTICILLMARPKLQHSSGPLKSLKIPIQVWKWKWCDIRPSMVTHWICALQLTHPKCTHTAVNTPTPWTHTRSSGQPFMLRLRGAVGGLVPCSRIPQSLRVERALYIHSPRPTIPAGPRLELATFWVTSPTL